MSVTHQIVGGELGFNGPILMTPIQASEYLNIPVTTLADYRVRKIGPIFCKLQGQIRYLKSDLDDWIAASRQITGHDE